MSTASDRHGLTRPKGAASARRRACGGRLMTRHRFSQEGSLASAVSRTRGYDRQPVELKSTGSATGVRLFLRA